MRVDDLTTDPRFTEPNTHERQVAAAGLRSALLVPLPSGARVIGAAVFTSFGTGAYTETHVEAALVWWQAVRASAGGEGNG